jgi:hypothetical protein
MSETETAQPVKTAAPAQAVPSPAHLLKEYARQFSYDLGLAQTDEGMLDRRLSAAEIYKTTQQSWKIEGWKGACEYASRVSSDSLWFLAVAENQSEDIAMRLRALQLVEEVMAPAIARVAEARSAALAAEKAEKDQWTAFRSFFGRVAAGNPETSLQLARIKEKLAFLKNASLINPQVHTAAGKTLQRLAVQTQISINSKAIKEMSAAFSPTPVTA